MFNRSEVIVLTTNKQIHKQTNKHRFCWKHPPRSAMLCRWKKPPTGLILSSSTVWFLAIALSTSNLASRHYNYSAVFLL